jgi:CheY-like chemotaxis protein
MKTKKVLVVDDELLIRSTTLLLLKRQGLEAVAAKSGAEGIAIAQRTRPDMILLDIMMPEMDGWEVLKRLKQSTVTSEIPVIVFSAADFEVTDEELRERGAVTLLRKPFHLSELVRVVNLIEQRGEK